jgi:hypothetical protein
MSFVRKNLASAFLVVRVVSCFLSVGFHGAYLVHVVRGGIDITHFVSVAAWTLQNLPIY